MDNRTQQDHSWIMFKFEHDAMHPVPGTQGSQKRGSMSHVVHHPAHWRWSICTTWPPGPWARMDVKHSELPKNSLSQSILPLATFFSLKSDKPRTTASSQSHVLEHEWCRWGWIFQSSEWNCWLGFQISCLRSWAIHDSNVPWRLRNSPR